MSKYSTKKVFADYESEEKKTLTEVNQLKFTGVNGRDVYNLASPIMMGGEMILAGRTEPRENHESVVYLFIEKGDMWHPLPNWEPIKLEDPFFIRIGNKDLMGAVKTFPREDSIFLGWKTVIFDISDLKNPKEIFEGPSGMKDLRFVEYPDKRIGVFTRPQKGDAGRGTCGYLETDSLDSLKPEDVTVAKLISSPDEDSWEGINQAFMITDDLVGLLGHIAWMGEGKVRHYYAVVAEFSRKTGEKTPWRIIAQRSDFPEGPAKRDDLVDVLFPGGIDLLNKDEAVLYVGLSDTEAWKCKIPNPFANSRKI